jgi:thioesterase domain-containing protein
LTPRELLAHLRRHDILVFADGDRLRCNAPLGALTEDLRAELANRKPEILTLLRTGQEPRSSVVPIQPAGSKPAFFAVPGHNGDVFCYVRLSHHLGADQPFLAFEPPGVDGRRSPLTSVAALAALFVDDLRAWQPEGPYLLGGYCAGGVIAFEMAQQLHAAGERVALLVLFESSSPALFRRVNLVKRAVRHECLRLAWTLRELAEQPASGRRDYLAKKLRSRLSFKADGESSSDPVYRSRVAVEHATVNAVRAYRLRPYSGRLCYVYSNEQARRLGLNRQRDWERFAAGGLLERVGPNGQCTSATMLREPYVADIARVLAADLEACAEEHGLQGRHGALRCSQPVSSR